MIRRFMPFSVAWTDVEPAERAISAFVDNAASLAVSRRLGYADDGIERQVVRGRPQSLRRLRLDRASWQAHRTIAVTISGLEPCLPFFGAAPC